MPEDAAKQSAPYLPFRTFLNALDALNHGVPQVIDRTIWRTQPGGTQGQIMGALRFFGLIDELNKPTSNLLRLVDKREHRQAAIRALLEWSYADLVKSDLTKMTMKMLEDSIQQYGVSGETRKKAITFFLQAAKFADLALSPYLQMQIRATPGTRKRRRTPEDDSASFESANGSSSSNTEAHNETIQLKSGGTVSLTVSINPFKLEKEDRVFVFELIDKLTGYGKPQPIKTEKVEKTA
jgi:hypothetical protein